MAEGKKMKKEEGKKEEKWKGKGGKRREKGGN